MFEMTHTDSHFDANLRSDKFHYSFRR